MIAILVLVYLIYVGFIAVMIVGFIRARYSKPYPSGKGRTISIIIPVRNEEVNIVACLESLDSQDYDMNNFEVIVVDDHSTDKTHELVNDYKRKSRLNLQLYRLEDGESKKTALTYGIQKSNYDVIATTDGDCVLPREWLLKLSNEFDKGIAMLMGPVMFIDRKGFLSQFQVLDMLALQGVEFGMLGYNNPILNNAANLSYSKKEFLNAGGYDHYNTPSGDDIFLMEKFKSNNNRVIGLLDEGFIVQTKPMGTVRELIQQRVRWSSKSKFYRDLWLKFLGALILIQNISLIFTYFGFLAMPKYWIILSILVSCKWLIDFILLLLVARFFKREKTLIYFVPVQLIYPIYVLVVWVMSMFGDFEWKGRKFNEYRKREHTV